MYLEECTARDIDCATVELDFFIMYKRLVVLWLCDGATCTGSGGYNANKQRQILNSNPHKILSDLADALPFSQTTHPPHTDSTHTIAGLLSIVIIHPRITMEACCMVCLAMRPCRPGQPTTCIPQKKILPDKGVQNNVVRVPS